MAQLTLGEFEQIVLAAALIEKNNYGLPILERVRILLEGTGRSASMGAVYTTLDRLEKKGYLKSSIGGSTHERGGRSKRFYAVQRSGRNALKAALAITVRVINAVNANFLLP